MLKRLFDCIVAIVALVALSPVLTVAALAVGSFLGRPVLFRQQRPGLKGNPFTIYKFRTMKDTRDSHGNLLPDEQRLPPFGHFLRSTSIDELPELFNVIKGDMSLVGPRPLLMEYLDRYTPEQQRRHDVKPGITGWAQINGRNAITWDEKFGLDLWYVDHHSFFLDLKILVLTIKQTFKREGIHQEGHVTAAKFNPPCKEPPNDR
jgi:sugar transferase EpsL